MLEFVRWRYGLNFAQAAKVLGAWDEFATVRRRLRRVVVGRDLVLRFSVLGTSSHVFRHTYRTWLDSTGSPVGVQKQLMRHSDIRTTMNIYGDAITADMRQAQTKVAALALPKSLN